MTSAAWNEIVELRSLQYFVNPAIVDHVTVQHGVKDLNIKNTYASDKSVSVKEHLQNWKDQCVSINDDPHMDLIPSTFQLNSGWTVHIYSKQSAIVLGWIAVKTLPNGLLHIELFNSATQLEPDNVLVMGQTSKANGIGMAGYFGEGVKVEINRLLHSNAQVLYVTNGTVWKFAYSVKSILHASVEPASADVCSGPNTRVVLTNVPISAYNPLDYLFITPCITVFRSKVHNNKLSGLQVLLDDVHKGRVYLHGIFVTRLDGDQILFGLNYVGPNKLAELGIGRDRDTINLVRWLWLVPDLFTDNVSNPNYADLCRVFYRSLDARSNAVVSNFKPSYITNEKIIADAMLRIFIDVHGTKAIPYQGRVMPNDQSEAVFLDCSIVVVSDHLHAWLISSSNCPTLDKMWKANLEAVMSLPEVVFDHIKPESPNVLIRYLSKEHAEYACQLRSWVSTYFESDAIANKLKFKDFSVLTLQNTRRFIPIKTSSSSQPNFYVLDMQLLDANLVHAELKKNDPSFKCLGKCGCILNTIIEDILSCFGYFDRQRLDAKFRKKFLNSLPSNLPTPDSSSAPILTDQAQPRSPQDIIKSTPTSANSVSAASSSGLSSPSTPRFSSSLAASCEVVDEEEEVEMVQEDRKAQKGSLSSLLTDISASVQHCGAPPVCMPCDEFSTLSSKRIFPAQCIVKEATCYKNVGNTRHSGMTVLLETGEIEGTYGAANINDMHMTRLSSCVVFLAKYVFNYPLQSCGLFVEDSGTIAFNRGGCIFFNYVAMLGLLAKPGISPVDCLDFWFSTFCHELTHNIALGHDANFATAFGFNITCYVSKYRANCLSLANCTWEQFVKSTTQPAGNTEKQTRPTQKHEPAPLSK